MSAQQTSPELQSAHRLPAVHLLAGLGRPHVHRSPAAAISRVSCKCLPAKLWPRREPTTDKRRCEGWHANGPRLPGRPGRLHLLRVSQAEHSRPLPRLSCTSSLRWEKACW